jgi:hypothetical protein
MRLGAVLVALMCAAGFTVSACSLISHPPTARSLADKIGCTGYQPQQQATDFFRETGECYLAGSTDTLLVIMTFSSNHSRDEWLQIDRTSGSRSAVVWGNFWVVQEDSPAASTVQKALGGQIQYPGTS